MIKKDNSSKLLGPLGRMTLKATLAQRIFFDNNNNDKNFAAQPYWIDLFINNERNDLDKSAKKFFIFS